MDRFRNQAPFTAAAKPARTTRWALVLMLGVTHAGAATHPGILLRAITTETRKVTPQPVSPATTQSDPAAAKPAKISYSDGQLTIRALNMTVGEILTKVSSLTGMKLDVPATVSKERMPFVDEGPGPAREVLASLLGGSSFDFLIQSSDSDPDNIQSVILMPRDAKGSNAAELPRPTRGPYARGGAPPVVVEESPAPQDTSSGIQQDVAAPAEAVNSSSPVPEPPPSQPAPSLATPPGQGVFNQPRPGGAQNVPADLSPQSINQQLHQMYQQRMQINQQERQTVTPQAK